RYVAYTLEADSNTRAFMELIADTNDPRDDEIKETFVDNPNLEMFMRDALHKALRGDYSGVRSYFLGSETDLIEGETHDLTFITERIPFRYDPFNLPIPAWNDSNIIDIIKNRKAGGEPN